MRMTTKLEKGGMVNEMLLYVSFSKKTDYEKAKDFFANKSGFSAQNEIDEFKSIGFVVSSQEDADFTEIEITKELNKAGFDNYRFELEDSFEQFKNGGMVHEDVFAYSEMRTKDGIIVGQAYYNPYYKKYQVKIDGVIYGEHDYVEDAIDELSRSGFKSIKKYSKGGNVATRKTKTAADFQVGTPANYHTRNDGEQAGEIVMRDGKKTISLYPNRNYGGRDRIVIDPDKINWNNMESFADAAKRTGEPFMFAEGGNVESGKLTAQEVEKFIAAQNTWFELEDATENRISYTTRENGNMGNDTAGSADIAEAKRLKKIIDAKFEQAETTVDTMDEWVNLIVKINTPASKEYKYAPTLRPLDIGTYPKDNFVRLESNSNYPFGAVAVYSEPLSLTKISHFDFFPITDLEPFVGKEMYYEYAVGEKVKVSLSDYDVVLTYDDGSGEGKHRLTAVNFLRDVKDGQYKLLEDKEGSESSICDETPAAAMQFKKVNFIDDDSDYFYYVIREEGNKYIAVSCEKIEHWLESNEIERYEYYEEIIPMSEMREVGQAMVQELKSELAKMGNKSEQLATAMRHGKNAYNRGAMMIPAQDASLMRMLTGRKVGETPTGEATSKELMSAWESGWFEAKKEANESNPYKPKVGDEGMYGGSEIRITKIYPEGFDYDILDEDGNVVMSRKDILHNLQNFRLFPNQNAEDIKPVAPPTNVNITNAELAKFYGVTEAFIDEQIAEGQKLEERFTGGDYIAALKAAKNKIILNPNHYVAEIERRRKFDEDQMKALPQDAKDLEVKFKNAFEQYQSSKSKSDGTKAEEILNLYLHEIVLLDFNYLTRYLELDAMLPKQFRQGLESLYNNILNDNTDWAKYLRTNIWELLPASFTETPKIKRIEVKSDPEDKGLANLLVPFTGRDELRPNLLGVYFDDLGITATNAHILFHLKTESDVRGIYCVDKKCLKETEKEQVALSNLRYPDYQAVVPRNNSIEREVKTDIILTFLIAAEKAKAYENSVTEYVVFAADNTVFAFNLFFAITVFEAFKKLGYDEVELLMSSPVRGVVVIPKGNKRALESLDSTFALLMPAQWGMNPTTYIQDLSKGQLYFNLDDESVVTAGAGKPYPLGQTAVSIAKPMKAESEKKPVKAMSQSDFEFFKGLDHLYKNPFQLNRAIEELIKSKNMSSVASDYSTDEKMFLKKYSGMGGLEKYGATGIGLKYEYFTPDEIVKKMWGLAYKHGYNNGKVLEPSCGIGSFLEYAPDKSNVVGYEINPYSAVIAKVLYPQVSIIEQPFETVFIKDNSSIKAKTAKLDKYDLVIGNPPYGKFEGKQAGMGEKSYTKASNYIEYFILRGLDLLNTDGLLIMIIGTEVAIGGTPFLQQGMTPTKKMIAEKADLLEAYRLPNGVFDTTDALTDIVVIKKK